ncbi:MAG: diacylglycerol kinase family protein [Bacteroidia bacterium]
MKIGNIKYAIKGIWLCLKNESNFRIHIAAAILATIAGFYFEISTTEWLIQTLCIGLIFFAEAVNTAIEELVNKISPEWNAHAGKIKDIASGAVLLISIFVFICGTIIYWSKVAALL